MPFGPYYRFARANARLVGFGFLMAFASSFGQSFFVGAFVPEIEAAFDLSHTGWGTIYMVGTLASALLLPWSGKQIDRLDLRLYTTIVLIALAVACIAAAATPGAIVLVVIVFLLRQSGQGLASHTAITTMARYFDFGRGRALAIASLGFSVGEAVLPLAAVAAIAWVGWRWSYAGAGLIALVVFLPLALWLLRGHGARHASHVAAGEAAGESAHAGSWTRMQMLRDPRFWLLLPGVFAPSLVMTAMFINHRFVAEDKGWSAAWITGNYVVYAIATIATSLFVGHLLDRIPARRLVTLMLLPLALSLAALAWGQAPFWVWPYFVLAGFSGGFGHTAISALWPELYGTRHLGAIKSLAASMGVFASALGPVLMGLMMDNGLSTDGVCWIFAAYCLGGSATTWLALRPGFFGTTVR